VILPVSNTIHPIHPKRDKFAMGVKINTTDESQLHDSPEKVYII